MKDTDETEILMRDPRTNYLIQKIGPISDPPIKIIGQVSFKMVGK